MLTENTKARRQPSFFQVFTVKSFSSSISGASLALSLSELTLMLFFNLNPKMLKSQYCVQALKMKDLFLIKANKMMSTLKLSFKPSGLILFLIKKTFHLRKKNKIKIYTVKLKCYILGSFFADFGRKRFFERFYQLILFFVSPLGAYRQRFQAQIQIDFAKRAVSE